MNFHIPVRLVIALVWAGISLFGQIPIFGPEQFVRGTEAPVTYTRNFSAPDTAQQYTIKVQNGRDQATRVSSAELQLNGRTIFGPNDFNKTVEALERKLSLQATNQLTLRIPSDPGAFLVVTIFAPYAATGTVGGSGGTIEVTSTSSPIFGTKLVIPPNAIPPSQTPTITVNFSDNLPGPLPPNGQKASKVFLLEKTMKYNFTIPIAVTIPLDLATVGPQDMPVVFYWSPTYNKYRPATVTAINRTGKTITFRTAHFTAFVAIIVPGISLLAMQQGIDTGFRSNVDGFYHPNFGSYDSPGGSCLGMALYSAWYYGSKKAIDGTPLYQKYRQGNPTAWQDDTTARELISRAFIASSQTWAQLWLLIDVLTPNDTALAMWTALWVTGEPQALLFKGVSNGSPFGHAVTVSAWRSGTQQFEIYDNNFPGETATLNWSALSGFNSYSKAALYGTITNFAFEGMGTVLEGSEFETFYQGAEAGWTNSKFKTISVTNPAPDVNGVIITPDSQNVVIQGNATGGIQPASFIVPYLNGSRLPVTAISGTGEFSMTLPSIPSVTNTLSLIATNDQNDSWYGFNAYAGFKEYPVKVQGRVFLTNPGFETGNFTGWQHETHTWQNPTPNSFQPEKSAIAFGGPDPIDLSLQPVYTGQYAARINNSDNNYHISSISQTAVVPNVARPEVRLYWAAVLEDPQHPPEAQPYVDVVIRDETAGQTLYARHFYSNDPSFSGWRSVQNGAWKTIPWQVITLPLQNAVGHTISVRVTAADCGYGGHGGYAYLDGDIN